MNNVGVSFISTVCMKKKTSLSNEMSNDHISDEAFFADEKYKQEVPEDIFVDESSGKKRIPLNLSEEEREKRKKEHEEKKERDRIEREKREKHYQDLEDL
jgi:hypothetical protein